MKKILLLLTLILFVNLVNAQQDLYVDNQTGCDLYFNAYGGTSGPCTGGGTTGMTFIAANSNSGIINMGVDWDGFELWADPVNCPNGPATGGCMADNLAKQSACTGQITCLYINCGTNPCNGATINMTVNITPTDYIVTLF